MEGINSELSGRNDVEVRVEVDAGSLLRGEDAAANGRLVGKIVDDVLRNFVYAVTEANGRSVGGACAKVIRVGGGGVRERGGWWCGGGGRGLFIIVGNGGGGF